MKIKYSTIDKPGKESTLSRKENELNPTSRRITVLNDVKEYMLTISDIEMTRKK